MLRWCVYCQEFQGEVSPFEDFSITHGMCPGCKAKGIPRLEDEIDRAIQLRELQGQLMNIGRLGDVGAAESVIERALSVGVRAVDILVGLITPLLYTIGAEWERGELSVAEEQRFTTFCEDIFDLLRQKHQIAPPETDGTLSPTVVVVNAYGNIHTLGIRVLAMWLSAKGIDARVFFPTPTPIELQLLCRKLRPAALLISLALAEQRPGVVSIARPFAAVDDNKPIIAVGGYAVKMGLVKQIPATLFVTDPMELVDMLRRIEV